MLSACGATILIVAVLVRSASATAPCDFKGLSVGDVASPRQIMEHFGVVKFKDRVAELANQSDQLQREAFDKSMKRAKEVGLMNATEEEEMSDGPTCSNTSCRLPFGIVSVGEEPYPIPVEVFVAFNAHQKITAVDIKFDRTQWNEILELMNTKFGNDWKEEVTEDLTSNYSTRKSHMDRVINLTHISKGINRQSGTTCTIWASSRDVVFEHSLPPLLRGVMEIKLLSTNF